jgi:hypothetical protein
MDRMKEEFSFLNPFLILLILLILSVFFWLRLAALRLSQVSWSRSPPPFRTLINSLIQTSLILLRFKSRNFPAKSP